jgi:hypothetical protein
MVLKGELSDRIILQRILVLSILSEEGGNLRLNLCEAIEVLVPLVPNDGLMCPKV